MSKLFEPFSLRTVEFRNRIFVSPMCQYSSHRGLPTSWHFVHLGSRAVGGAGLVMVEASAVSPEGRISPSDSGIWSDDHASAFEPVVDFIDGQGAVPGIQIAHAGRKASTRIPWTGRGAVRPDEGGWEPVAPSAEKFHEQLNQPRELELEGIEQVVEAFGNAAERSVNAGFRVIEIHMAHGYLLHEFLSPVANRREDEFGGSFENRARLPLRVAERVRDRVPDELPVFVRISCVDHLEREERWDLDQSVRLAGELKRIGVDLVDCSSGGISPEEESPGHAGYMVPYAARIREEAEIPTGAVGGISEPRQAEQIVANGRADAVLMAREFLRDPYWPLHAAEELGVAVDWPDPYHRVQPIPTGPEPESA